MVTALALYSGRALSEFELVGMTTNPDVIKQVIEILTKSDTAGEVLHALVRCIGIVVISDRDSEVYHASPDADRTHPP